MRRDFWPANQLLLKDWINQQITGLATNATALGLSTAQVGELTARLEEQKDLLATLLSTEQAHNAAVANFNQGSAAFEKYYREQIKHMKSKPGLSASIPTEMGWESSGTQPPNPDTTKPKITGRHLSPLQVDIDFVRGPFDGVDVELSYDNNSWEKGGFDNRSPFEDKRPNKSPEPENRFYRFMYRYKGQPFGQWSDVVQVTAAISPS